MAGLTASVGYGGTNNFGDVLAVQLLLNNHIAFGPTLSRRGIAPLVAHGQIGDKWDKSDVTIHAITAFQKHVLGFTSPDGRVDPGGRTYKALVAAPRVPTAKRVTRKIVVDLTFQRVTAYAGATVFRTCECVTGDASHPTPKGRFKITRKHHPYTSKKYGVQMDYAMFFKSSGEALHQYHGPAPWTLLRLGRSLTTAVGSHGCVRLQEADAKALYGWAAVGTPVEVK